MKQRVVLIMNDERKYLHTTSKKEIELALVKSLVGLTVTEIRMASTLVDLVLDFAENCGTKEKNQRYPVRIRIYSQFRLIPEPTLELSEWELSGYILGSIYGSKLRRVEIHDNGTLEIDFGAKRTIFVNGKQNKFDASWTIIDDDLVQGPSTDGLQNEWWIGCDSDGSFGANLEVNY